MPPRAIRPSTCVTAQPQADMRIGRRLGRLQTLVLRQQPAHLGRQSLVAPHSAANSARRAGPVGTSATVWKISSIRRQRVASII